MDVISACQQVGTYRGAAAMCGVNHKTVKRIIKAAPLRSAAARRHAGLCLGRPARRTPGQHAQQVT